MKTHLISGGCGFVGRNMVKRLYNNTDDRIVFIDDLSVGTHPDTWLKIPKLKTINGLEVYGEEERLLFLKADFRKVLNALEQDPDFFNTEFNLNIDRFADVFHFAAIVGGRAKIDGDPIQVALDLAIDSEFFYWVSRHKPERVLYPSSSAAYPISLQTESNTLQLKESDIDFDNMGQPDMTYGWTKLTGEFLAQITAKHYGIHITCIRPFSGYGEDQDYSYPTPAIARRAVFKEAPFEVWGSGHQGRDFVHIDDVLDCVEVAMDNIHDGRAINIGQGILTSFRDLIGIFCEFAGYSPEIKPLLDKPVGVHSRYCDMTWVKENLGWEPKISIKEGMKRVYDAVMEREKAAGNL
ncbi:NAD-dependent epimerase/dehydratase family protein [Mangrovimonas sp. AS39]|uniref:NAD-dependent epimerase/dehydratase family protein n=1 Tax=Mangrovimonas futianensis TaxID=2895523 RepID=UPI001E32B462|nr:NAD-dependent epimerase/dehydratase family protein [Mangrovimonas futianensis]MCF1190812.1 NAD-dependent epimerase/dehydratase family protein [Mangrovimonas futianensis]MCF1194509.1 NAD-dependent epimerase/dehydratase family protein [Mangrovimonas futianensis]